MVVVVVGGCRWHCGSGRSGGKPTQWRLWQQDQLIEHRQQAREGAWPRPQEQRQCQQQRVQARLDIFQSHGHSFMYTVQSIRLKSPCLLNRGSALAKNTKIQP
jgi:hypothetical protein